MIFLENPRKYDLKSPGVIPRAGSSPAPGTKELFYYLHVFQLISKLIKSPITSRKLRFFAFYKPKLSLKSFNSHFFLDFLEEKPKNKINRIKYQKYQGGSMLGVNTHLMGEIESLLLAVDASEQSKGAAQEAVTIALECEAKLYILYMREYHPEVPEALLAALEGIPEEHRAFLEKVKSMVEKEGGEAEIIIRDHPEAWRVIIEEAEKLKTDLIVMGKRGRTGLKKLFMGSVTEKVIGYAPCKVMVVPKDVVVYGEVILVATDGSYFAKKAEKEALSMGKRCSTLKKIIALSVARRESDIPKTSKILEAFKKLAQEEQLPPRVKIETLEVVGNPPEMIVKVAEDELADLILMGEYGKTGIQKFIMGSTTAKTIGLARKSAVLVTK